MPANPFADGLEAQISADSSGFDQAIGSATDSLSSFKGAVAGAGVAIGALSTKALASAVGAAADFESAMVGVEKVTDPETADRMADAIQGMSAEMPIAQEELAGVAEAAGRLGVAEENLESFTETAAQMGVATDISAEEAADAFARISTLMDIPLDQSEELGSAINELANNFGTSASEISDAMTRAGGAMNTLGVGKEEALGLAAAMNEVSPSSRLAAGRLQRVSNSLQDPATVNSVAEAFGKTSEEMQSIVDNNPQKAIMMIAKAMNEGGETANALRDAMGKTASDLSALGGNLDAVEGATQSANEQFENATSLQAEADTASSTFSAQIEILRNRLRNVAIDIGSVLLPYLSDLLEYVIQGVEWFSRLNDKTSGVAGAVALLVGAVGGFIVAGGALLSMAGGLTAVLAPLGAGFAALGTTIGILLGPIGLLIGAVVLLAAIFSGKMPEILDTVDRVFAQLPGLIERGITTAITWIQTTGIPMAVRVGRQMAQNAVEAIGLLAEWLPPRVEAAIRALVRWLSTSGVSLAIQGFNLLVDAATTAFDFLVNDLPPIMRRAIGAAVEWLRTDGVALAIQAITLYIDTMTRIFGLLAEHLPPIMRRAITAAVNWLTTDGVSLARQAITLYIDTLVSIFSFIINDLPGIMADAIGAVVAWIRTSGIPLARQGFTLLVGAIETAFGAVVDFLSNAISRAFTAMVDYITGLGITDIKSAFKALGTAIRTVVLTFLSVGGTLWTIWTDFWKGIGQWLKTDAGPMLKSAAEAAFDGLVAALQLYWDEVVPPGLVSDMIVAITEWLISEGPGLLQSAAETMFDGIVAALDLIYQEVVPPGLVSDMIGAIVDWLVNTAPGLLMGAAETAFNAIMAAATGLYEGLIGKSLIPEMFQDIASYITGAATSLVTAAVDSFIGGLETLFEQWAGWIIGGGGLVQGIFQDIQGYIGGTGKSLVEGAVQSVIDAAKAVFDVVGEFVGKAEALIGGVVDGVNNQVSAAAGAAQSVVDAVKGAFDIDLTSAGKGMVSGVVSGIRSKISAARDAASDLAGAVKDNMPGSDAEEGPLSNLTADAAAIPETLAEQMQSNLRAVERASGELAASARPEVGPPDAVAGGRQFVNNGDIHIHGDVDDPEGLADDLLRHVEARW